MTHYTLQLIKDTISEHIQDIEQHRWHNYAKTLQKDESIVQKKFNSNPSGKSGVAYNILTNEYLTGEAGDQLRGDEARRMVNTIYYYCLLNY